MKWTLFRNLKKQPGSNQFDIGALQPFSYHKVLSEHQYERLHSLIPTEQLGLFHNVLLLTLGTLNKTLGNQVIAEDINRDVKRTVFDVKFTDLCLVLQHLKNEKHLLLLNSTGISRNNALFAFIFYRVLLCDLHLCIQPTTNNDRSELRDKWHLLKRIPPRLFLYLGANAWRLFEFKEVVYGNLKVLELNQDIVESIESALSVLGKKEEVSVKTDTTSVPEVKQDNTPVVVNTPIENDDVSPKRPTVKKKKDKSSLEIRFINYIKKNLEQRHADYQINVGVRLFAEPLQYGGSTLFIGDRVIYDFQHAIKSGQSFDDIKAVLMQSGILLSEHYELIPSQGKKIPLCRLNVDFKFVTLALKGEIREITS